MANVCTNKVVVIGPPEAVSRFVEAARGMTFEPLTTAFQTEMKLIEEVRNGRPVADAFRDTNVRIDELAHRLSELPLSYLLSSGPILPPVSEAEFPAWAAEKEDLAKAWLKHQGDPEETWLSMDRLAPMPEEYSRESYGLVGHAWVESERGPKWAGPVTKPEIVDSSAAVGLLGEGFGQESGHTVAAYPLFDTANSPIFPALLNASRSHPDLTILSAFMDPGGNDFRYFAAKGGEVLAERRMQDDGLPEDCILDDGDGFAFPDDKSTLDYLVEMALVDAEESVTPPQP